MASSKLYPRHGMNATSTLYPRASSPSVDRRTVRDHVAGFDSLAELVHVGLIQ